MRAMPIKRAAKKAYRQSEKHRHDNRVLKDAMKKDIKEITKLVAAQKLEEASKMLPAVYQVIDKVAQKNLIHKKNAAHKKSSVAKLVSPKK